MGNYDDWDPDWRPVGDPVSTDDDWNDYGSSGESAPSESSQPSMDTADLQVPEPTLGEAWAELRRQYEEAGLGAGGVAIEPESPDQVARGWRARLELPDKYGPVELGPDESGSGGPSFDESERAATLYGAPQPYEYEPGSYPAATSVQPAGDWRERARQTQRAFELIQAAEQAEWQNRARQAGRAYGIIQAAENAQPANWNQMTPGEKLQWGIENKPHGKLLGEEIGDLMGWMGGAIDQTPGLGGLKAATITGAERGLNALNEAYTAVDPFGRVIGLAMQNVTPEEQRYYDFLVGNNLPIAPSPLASIPPPSYLSVLSPQNIPPQLREEHDRLLAEAERAHENKPLPTLGEFAEQYARAPSLYREKTPLELQLALDFYSPGNAVMELPGKGLRFVQNKRALRAVQDTYKAAGLDQEAVRVEQAAKRLGISSPETTEMLKGEYWHAPASGAASGGEAPVGKGPVGPEMPAKREPPVGPAGEGGGQVPGGTGGEPPGKPPIAATAGAKGEDESLQRLEALHPSRNKEGLRKTFLTEFEEEANKPFRPVVNAGENVELALAAEAEEKGKFGLIFASPNKGNLTLDQAVANLRSSRHQWFERGARALAEALIPDSETRRALGVWIDGAENSVAIIVGESIDASTLDYLGARLGHVGEQKQILRFKADADGLHALYVFDVASKDVKALYEDALARGVPHMSFVSLDSGTRVLVFDEFRKLSDNVFAFGGAHGATNQRIWSGTGRWLGDPEGLSREIAELEYARVIREDEKTGLGGKPGRVFGHSPRASGETRSGRQAGLTSSFSIPKSLELSDWPRELKSRYAAWLRSDVGDRGISLLDEAGLVPFSPTVGDIQSRAAAAAARAATIARRPRPPEVETSSQTKYGTKPGLGTRGSGAFGEADTPRMLLQYMRQQLSHLGYSSQQIDQLSLSEAAQIIAEGRPPKVRGAESQSGQGSARGSAPGGVGSGRLDAESQLDRPSGQRPSRPRPPLSLSQQMAQLYRGTVAGDGYRGDRRATDQDAWAVVPDDLKAALEEYWRGEPLTRAEVQRLMPVYRRYVAQTGYPGDMVKWITDTLQQQRYPQRRAGGRAHATTRLAA